MQRPLSAIDFLISVPEAEAKLGEDLRALRLSKNMSQQMVAERAGVGEKAVRRLESGQGSTLSTLIAIVGVLGREGWLNTIAPVASINPLTMPTRGTKRQRASAKTAQRGMRSATDIARTKHSGIRTAKSVSRT